MRGAPNRGPLKIPTPGSIPAVVNYTGQASDTSKSLGECLRLQSNHRATGSRTRRLAGSTKKEENNDTCTVRRTGKDLGRGLKMLAGTPPKDRRRENTVGVNIWLQHSTLKTLYTTGFMQSMFEFNKFCQNSGGTTCAPLLVHWAFKQELCLMTIFVMTSVSTHVVLKCTVLCQNAMFIVYTIYIYIYIYILHILYIYILCIYIYIYTQYNIYSVYIYIYIYSNHVCTWPEGAAGPRAEPGRINIDIIIMIIIIIIIISIIVYYDHHYHQYYCPLLLSLLLVLVLIVLLLSLLLSLV